MSSQKALCFTVPISPSQISVNMRFQKNNVIPRDVRQGMKDVQAAVEQQLNDTGFRIAPNEMVALSLDFFFRSWAGDIDNPIKRTIDAMVDAINADKSHPRFDDNRIIELHVRKLIAERDTAPRIEGCLRVVEGGRVKTPTEGLPQVAPVWVG